MKEIVNILWFKRDLRIHDSAPLLEVSCSGFPVIPLYVVETNYWQQPFASRRHWSFIHDCLVDLNIDCTNLGQPLIIRVGNIIEILNTFNISHSIRGIYSHEESGNGWTYSRDKKVNEWCKNHFVPNYQFPSNGVVRHLENRDEWSKIRNSRMVKPLIVKPQRLEPIRGISSGDIPSKDDPLFGSFVCGNTQKGGRREAIRILKSFLDERSKNYIYSLSSPGKSEKYCSRLSPHLTWGTVSVREVYQSCENQRKNLTHEESKTWTRNLAAFRSRLSWRCHFIQKIEDQPSIEFRCMHPAFEDIRKNEHNETYYQAWKDGLTGYPFVDACMRNLIYEGWITFRMRAMLMSFASYHLWLDWRITGQHLAQLFTDYEPGIHYSQLQMQSGVTGINTLRIYNPTKQSHEHDKKGIFIKQWLPELQNVPSTWIHEPFKMNSSMQRKTNCIIGTQYPKPIVDQELAAKYARSKIEAIRKQLGYKEEAKKIYTKLGSRKRSQRKKKRKTSFASQLLLDLK